MLYYFAGAACSVPVEFKLDGELVNPDQDSVTSTVRGHDGLPIAGLTDVAHVTDATTDRIYVQVTDVANATSADMEKRTVEVNWTYQGAPQKTLVHYRLIPWLNHVVSPEDVRSLLGVGEFELKDDEIDLIASYFDVKEELGGTILEDALVGSDVNKAFLANNVIALRAALRVIPSLQLKVAQTEQDDNLVVKRLQKIDFNRLHQDLAREYARGIRLVANRSEVLPTLFTVVTPTDVVTGE